MYYEPFYLVSEYKAHINIILGTSNTGKTWGVTHYIESFINGVTAIIVRNNAQIRYMADSSPFYWDKTIKRKSWKLYRNDCEIANILSLSEIKLNDNLQVISNSYGAYNFEKITSVIFDDCNSSQTIGKAGDFNRFIEMLETITRYGQEITVFIIMNYSHRECDIASGFGFSRGLIDTITDGEIMCREYKNGLRVAFHKINERGE
jgi:hypothetical protein